MTGEVVALLKKRETTLATAESCTGGRLAAAFTAEPGASDYFLGGIVAYSNEVKINALGVYREILERHGAVSRQVAMQMAAGVRRLTGSDYAIATTGIAGPGGATSSKPVGTVWVALVGPDGVTTHRYRFTGTRAENMASAVTAAIEMLHRSLT